MIELADGEVRTFKWITGSLKKPVTVERKGERIWFSFEYNPKITEEIKASFNGYKWHGYENPPIKKWSAKYNQHNMFRLAFCTGQNPYAQYDLPLLEVKTSHPAMSHQFEMASHIITRKRGIIAGEMGVGKTLASIMAIDAVNPDGVLWVGPKSALYSVQLEFKKWNCKVWPDFSTYSSLKKLVENWPAGKRVYQMLVFDEGHKLKTVTSQRTQAAQYIADHVRKEWGNDGYINLMTGTPAPKSPIDWYSLCEIVCPGYLKEGNVHQFKNRMGVVREEISNITGAAFPLLVTWLDDEKKCKVCGSYEDNFIHDPEEPGFHMYVPSVNEVGYLHQRMNGLVIVKFKKDCIDLPEKIYRIINCKVPKELERAARLVAKSSTSAIKALTGLRELSDGFLYTEVQDGEEECPLCNGSKTKEQMMYTGPELSEEELSKLKEDKGYFDDDNIPIEQFFPILDFPSFYTSTLAACPHCSGRGVIPHMVRTMEEVKCPKDDALRDLLEEYEDIGRVVIYAGFTGSIDRVCRIVANEGWKIIRVDGRGWQSELNMKPEQLLELFQANNTDDKIAFVGHPASAGMGLTLTASPVVIYFSNDFSAEARIQSEDRIHRKGMDATRGATIIDIFNLQSDAYVLDNLKKKRDLQSLSLGQIAESLEQKDTENVYG